MKKFLLLLSLFSISAFAATPQSVVETIIERAKQLDSPATYTQNTRTIESLVDFQKISDAALGPNLKQATAAQKTQVRELLKSILTKTVYPEAARFFEDVRIEFKNEKKEGSKAQVTALVTKGQKRSTVAFFLMPESTSYRVIDLAIDGEHWVENIQYQFDEVIRKEGIAGLIKRMKKRDKELGSGKKKV